MCFQLATRLEERCLGWQDLIGVAPLSWSRMAMRKCEVLTLPLFQLIPHFLIALDVIQHPDAFTARVWDRKI